MVTATMIVEFKVRVPDGTDLDDLCLDIDTDTIGLSTTNGTPVRGGVTEYETTDVAALEEDGEDEE